MTTSLERYAILATVFELSGLEEGMGGEILTGLGGARYH